MPPIRGINCSGGLTLTENTGTQRTLNVPAIPSTVTNAAQLETYLNTVWLPAHTDGTYQAVAHVITFTPMVFTIYTARLGAAIPSNWWT